MGIKFFCDACDRKLNVKAFLAGKKGICPHCGARVTIPESSDTSPTGSNDLGGSTINEEPFEFLSPGAREMSVASAQPTSAAPASVVSASMPAPTATAVPVEVNRPSAAPATDPIAEAPNAVWYVRPPTGGQYGPAAGDVMSKWITEGRVSADSLVWREGWPEWRTAGPEFPALGGGAPAPAPSPASSENSNPATPIGIKADEPKSIGSASAAGYKSRKRGSSGMGMTIVVVLGLMVVILGIILVVILVSGDGKKKPKEDQASLMPPVSVQVFASEKSPSNQPLTQAYHL